MGFLSFLLFLNIVGIDIFLNKRLYGCLRLACGWILWHARPVDDGRFRKHICEALFVCYVLQALGERQQSSSLLYYDFTILSPHILITSTVKMTFNSSSVLFDLLIYSRFFFVFPLFCFCFHLPIHPSIHPII